MQYRIIALAIALAAALAVLLPTAQAAFATPPSSPGTNQPGFESTTRAHPEGHA